MHKSITFVKGHAKQYLNSLGPSDAIWRWRSWSTLVQVMAYCLTAPSHYLNQCWLIISKVLWHSSEDIIIRRFEDTNQLSKIENYIFKITLRSPRGQWVKIIRLERITPQVRVSHEYGACYIIIRRNSGNLDTSACKLWISFNSFDVVKLVRTTEKIHISTMNDIWAFMAVILPRGYINNTDEIREVFYSKVWLLATLATPMPRDFTYEHGEPAPSRSWQLSRLNQTTRTLWIKMSCVRRMKWSIGIYHYTFFMGLILFIHKSLHISQHLIIYYTLFVY